MTKLRQLPQENRPREKFLAQGAGGVSDVDHLAILLGSGTRGKNARQLAKQILTKFGGDLSDVTLAELRKFPGMGMVKAMRILSAFTLARRMQARQAGLEEGTQGFLFPPATAINGKVRHIAPAATPWRTPAPRGSFQLQNRRYLGNKHKLLGFIEDIVAEKCGHITSFCDLFAGTGVVGERFNAPQVKIIANDLLSSNAACLRAFLGVQAYNRTHTAEQLRHLNALPHKQDNYFSHHYGGKYFTQDNARKIGAIREEIEKIAANQEEKSILLCALIYAADKAANTVGHYDAFRKNMDSLQPIVLLQPDIRDAHNAGNSIHQEDANQLIQKIRCDVLYLDPPYNSRQYCDAYHLLENCAEWQKPEVRGICGKMDRTHLKSDYCMKSAPTALAALVQHAKCGHILLSYNNTGGNKDGRSNARIADAEITDILSAKGEVEVFERRYKAFTTGKSSAENHAERIFYCRVKGAGR